MTIRGKSVAAIVLFVIFAAYGIAAIQIEVFPGQELEPFKPRTMPFALAISGMLLCAVQILQTIRSDAANAIAWGTYDWKRAGFLCLIMLGYGFLLIPLGFVIATTLFLCAGFFTLGERRPIALLLVPVVFATVFWAVMTRLLGLYLAPGLWWPGGSA